jgi:hypothetical protein
VGGLGRLKVGAWVEFFISFSFFEFTGVQIVAQFTRDANLA